MKNYLLYLSFDGNDFHGSQKQLNQRTVQEEVENALDHILHEGNSITCCSRTDAGVHANMFCCNFFSEKQFESRRLIRGLNAVLPPSISVFDCRDVTEDFHSRKSCIKKEYVYKIWNGEQRNPFAEKYAFHFPRKIDEEFLNTQSKSFIGTHDFATFCASGSTVKSTIRTIYNAEVTRDGDYVFFRVTGDGFLYNMVRIMVGTLLDISDGKISADSIPDIIESKNRDKAGITAKPCGLYLNKVFYQENLND